MDDLTIGGVTFGEPLFLVLAAAAPLLLLIVTLGGLSRARAARRFASVRARVRNWRRILAMWPVALAVALMAVAAARPQWGERDATFRREGIDVVVALDVSLSMLTRDVEPSRLERAKDEIDEVLVSLRGDRVGLVTFSGDAVVRFPLTTDIAVARQLVRTTTVEPTRRAGSNPASAINAARSAFLDERSTTKVLLLITDGERITTADSEATDTKLEIERAREENIRIIIVGVGTVEGGLIPILDPATGEVAFKIDAATGLKVVSRLSELSLRALTENAGGQYVPLDDDHDLGAISDGLAQLTATAFLEETDSRVIERFQWFAGGALALLVVPSLLARLLSPGSSSGAKTTMAGTLAAAILIVGCGGDALLEANRDGNVRYEREDYEGALRKYREAQVERPDLPELNYNAANALFRDDDLDRAIEEVQRALSASDPALLASAYYSLGNYYASLDRWQEARAAYRNSLIHNPSDVDAKYNLEVANRNLTRRAPPPVASPDKEPGPSQSPAAKDGEAPPKGSPTPGAGGTPAADATVAPDSAGRPLPTRTPPTGVENPTDISREEESALRDALARLDVADPYQIEEALRILEMLRHAREGRASQLPVVPVRGFNDW